MYYRTRAVRTTRSREVIYTIFAILYFMRHETIYVIKDAWVSVDELEGKELEASLMARARSCIPLSRDSEEVHVKGEAGRPPPDTILNERQATSTSKLKL
jgi:hypothetical protein